MGALKLEEIRKIEILKAKIKQIKPSNRTTEQKERLRYLTDKSSRLKNKLRQETFKNNETPKRSINVTNKKYNKETLKHSGNVADECNEEVYSYSGRDSGNVADKECNEEVDLCSGRDLGNVADEEVDSCSESDSSDE